MFQLHILLYLFIIYIGWERLGGGGGGGGGEVLPCVEYKSNLWFPTDWNTYQTIFLTQ